MSKFKVDILAIAAHPDDIELSCSGTLLKHINEGDKVAIVDLTKGELGTRGTEGTRREEAKNASEVLGISFRENLDLGDGFFEENTNTLTQIIQVIRKYQPKIILTNALSDRHPDHERAAKLVARAAFLSGLAKITTSIKDQIQLPHRPTNVFHFIQDKYLTPDFVVDISPFFDQKMKSVSAYKTQFFKPGETNHGPKTPISGSDFYHFLEARAREFGRNIQVEYAEGFNCAKIPAVNLLWDLH